MISLFLTILCSTSIALILKYNDTRGGNPLVLLFGNYFIAALIGLLFVLSGEEFSFSIQTFLFGVFLAMLFVTAFFAFAKAVSAAGTALATVSSRLSVIVPVLLSIFIFNERPTLYQIFGIILTIFTTVLFYFSLKNSQKGHLRFKDYFYLLLVLIGIGLADFSLKVFQQWRPAAEKSYFIFTVFLFAALYTFLLAIIKRVTFDRSVLIRGGLLGIPNVFSTVFLLVALAQLPAIIVYPIINIGIIILTSLGAMLIWQEHLNIYGKWAVATGVVAIVLLGM
jgi:drug/metabolite transporter (DMT)-like permease